MNDRQQFFALVLGFGLWAVLGYLGKVPLDPLIALLQMGLGGLITHMLKGGAGIASAAPASVPPVASAQGGFVSLRLLVLVVASFLIAFGASLLTGCAGFQQTVTGYESAAKKGIEAFDDNQIEVQTTLLCATPLSAALRNPKVIPGLKALCLPGGNASNPADLLDGKQPITINLTLPPAAAAK